jgi:ring-1,2-phenylacetyl-CoA epoxidase subunit PaaB
LNDTQLPRYEVFVQERDGGPYLHAGGVHAADGELALLNARDVFARRPECRGLWIVPADLITRRTAEQLGGDPPLAFPAGTLEAEIYLVFAKIGHKGTHAYLGAVRAADPAEALQQSETTFGGEDVTSWWVVPELARRSNRPDESGAWFQTALDKPFRDQAFYPVETFMRELKRSRGPKDVSG